MKEINILLSFGLILSLASCGSSSKTSEEKKGTADSAIHVVNASVQETDTSALHAQRIEEGKKYLRNNWMNLIQVKSNNYKTGKNKTGIYNLTIEVENTTAYPIDSIKFLVPFYAKNECIQSVYVTAKKIPAEGKGSVKVPDNKDATRFQTQVRKVNSSAMELCFDIDDPNREGDDPNKCK